MTTNVLDEVNSNIRNMDRSKEAAVKRLQRMGVLTKSGKMTSLYRRCMALQNTKA